MDLCDLSVDIKMLEWAGQPVTQPFLAQVPSWEFAFIFDIGGDIYFEDVTYEDDAVLEFSKEIKPIGRFFEIGGGEILLFEEEGCLGKLFVHGMFCVSGDEVKARFLKDLIGEGHVYVENNVFKYKTEKHERRVLTSHETLLLNQYRNLLDSTPRFYTP
jgi:hypothetical protein